MHAEAQVLTQHLRLRIHLHHQVLTQHPRVHQHHLQQDHEYENTFVLTGLLDHHRRNSSTTRPVMETMTRSRRRRCHHHRHRTTIIYVMDETCGLAINDDYLWFHTEMKTASGDRRICDISSDSSTTTGRT